MIEFQVLFALSNFIISLDDLMILIGFLFVLPLYLTLKYFYEKGNTKEKINEENQSDNDSTSDSSTKPK